jgi:hypothetical protein
MSGAVLDFERVAAPEERAIVRAREKAEKTLGTNGADGISNIEGKVARVATS